MAHSAPVSPVANLHANHNQPAPLFIPVHNQPAAQQPQQWPIQQVAVQPQQPVKVDLIEYPGRGFTIPTWVIYCENEFNQYPNLTESNKINAAIRMLRDEELFNWANLWNRSNPNATFNQFAEALKALKRDANNDSRILNELRNMRLDYSKPNAIDSLSDYSNKFRSLVSNLYEPQKVGQLITAAYTNNLPDTLKAILRLYVQPHERELYTITDPTVLYRLVQDHAGEYEAAYQLDRRTNLNRIIRESNKRQRTNYNNPQQQSYKQTKVEQQTTTLNNAINTSHSPNNYSSNKRLDNSEWTIVKQYCKEHNLCFKCKQKYHGSNRFKKCNREPIHWTAEYVNNLKQQRQ